MKQVAPVYVVAGDEPILRREALDRLVASLLAGDDASLAVEEVTIPGRGDSRGGDDSDSGSTSDRGGVADAISVALNAARTPPFGTQRRIVVIHDTGALTAGQAEPLVNYITDPSPTSVLILVAGGGTMPAALVSASKKAGGEDVKAVTGIEAVLRDHLKAVDVHLDPDALSLATDRLGDDPGRVPAVVELLHSVFGPGAELSADQIDPYLGEPGVPVPYLLTNAIDSGDVAAALDILERLRTATGTRQTKPMHWLQIMGLLTSHYRKLVRLDSPSIANEDDAVAALGGRTKPFAAKKTWLQSQRLGTDRLRTAFDLLAQADLDLRGASGVPEDAVIEVLVVRLASMSRAAGASAGGSGGSRRASSARGRAARR